MRLTLCALALLAPLCAAQDGVKTRDLEGRYEVEVTRTNVHRTLPGEINLDVSNAGRVRFEIGHRQFRIHRNGDQLMGRVPPAIGMACHLSGGAPADANLLRLRIVNGDELRGVLSGPIERTELVLRRIRTVEDIAVRYWERPGEPVRYLASEAAWRAWYDQAAQNGSLEGRWAYLSASTAADATFVLGSDDTWIVTIKVARATGAIEVIGEH